MSLATFDIDRFLAGKPLAITEAGLEELKAHVRARLMMFDAGPVPALEMMVAQAAERSSSKSAKTQGSTGVISIRGTISQHASKDLSSFAAGGTATEEVSEQLKAFLADESIEKIVLDIDSPGGSSYGVAELAAEIYKSRGQKPIIAVANSLAASAAYWIGSSADQFFVTPGGMVGSIGCYAVHQDVSKMAENVGIKTTLISAGKYKVMGNQFEPLSDEARERVQERVDEVYDQFVADVARGRGVAASVVRGGFGEGDVLGAKKAKAEGMVDGIATFDQVVARPFRNIAAANGTQADAGDTDIEADEENPPLQVDEEGQKRLERMRLSSFRALAAASGAA